MFWSKERRITKLLSLVVRQEETIQQLVQITQICQAETEKLRKEKELQK